MTTRRSARKSADEAPAATGRWRNYPLSNSEFGELKRLVAKLTGIALTEAKRDLVYARFAKRLRALGLSSFAEYCHLVENGDIDEREHFVNAITTNLTSFFREPHHFSFLTNTVLPELRSRSSRRVRLWSAGCSTGEEPYSIAMTLLEAWPDRRGFDVKLLATDLDSDVLKKARAGSYDRRRVASVDARLQQRWFEPTAAGPRPATIDVNDELKQFVHFRRLNLMSDWPVRGPFEVIFCRNTIIYFDKPSREALFERFANLQAVGDWLFIGYSETLQGVTDRYQLVGRTVYRKIA